MTSNVNFLRERVRLQEEVLQKDKRLALVASIALGVFLSVVVAVFGYQLFLSTRQAELNRAIGQLDSQLTELSPLSTRHSERLNWLSLVRSIVQTRGKHWDAIVYIYGLLPTEAAISGVNVSKSEGMIQFSIQSPSVFVYRTVVSALQSQKVKDGGYDVSFGELQRGKDGVYELNVSLFFVATNEQG